MKKMTKRISLLFIICALIVPTWNVSATGEENTNTQTGGETTTPTVSPSPSPTPEVEKEKNDDATLKELTIDGAEFTEKFNPEKREYEAIVGSDVSSVKISATPNNVLSKIDDSSKTGLQQLVVGDNKFSVKVVAESGKEFVYEITITRATNDLNLTKLNIQGQKLNEVFDPEVTQYTADVTYNVTSITIQHGRPVGTNVAVSGNSNLKVGKNTVTVTVKNAVGDTKEYKIIVTRGEEENLDEEDESTTASEEVYTSDVITSEDDNTTVSEDILEEETKSSNTLRSVIIITSSVLLLLIAGLGIYFYIRTGNSEKRRQKKIDKLKRKQAKIEEQLTGLMPVITEEQEKEYLNNNNNNNEQDIEGKVLEDEEFESTIEIEIEDEETKEEQLKKRRVDKTIFDDLDDLFDDRDE